MDEIIFLAGKVVGLVTSPSVILLALLTLGPVCWLVSRLWRRVRWLRWLGSGLPLLATGLWLGATLMGLGHYSLRALEQVYPQPDALPGSVDGIVVLGGGIATAVSEATGSVTLDRAGDRLATAARLAHARPEATLVYTGGRVWRRQGQPAAVYAQEWFSAMGIDPGRITTETRARSTWDNARYSLELVDPGPDERWVLVTSAWHMPRAMGAFAAAGWPEVIAYPADRRVDPGLRTLRSTPSRTLTDLDTAAHEAVGILGYALLGRWQQP